MTTTPVPDLTAQATVRETRGRMLVRVEERMRGFIAAERERWCELDPRGAVLVEAIAALLQAGGKRLRPAFCLSGFLAAGGDPTDGQVVEAAAALEFLHAFALLHDDVLDNSPLRRGEPTAHVRFTAEHEANRWHGEPRRYGEGVAILAGDLAHVYADRLVADLPAAAGPIWSRLRTEMIIGQLLDVAVAAELSADVRRARWIAVCKSGRYSIQRPLELGAAVAGRDGELTPAFEEYGHALGEAFQLRDDLIDAFGDTDATGKPVGLDFEQHKTTLLLCLAVQRNERVRELVSDVREKSWDAAALRAVLTEIGVRAEIEQRIDNLVETARQAIEGAPIDVVWQRELADMAIQVAHRDR